MFVYFVALAAFHRDTLLETRWLLESAPRVSCHAWRQILTVTPRKQVMFVSRLLYLHNIQSRRGGKGKLPSGEWNAELDRQCLFGHAFDAMAAATADDGGPLFPAELQDTLLRRSMEGPNWHVW